MSVGFFPSLIIGTAAFGAGELVLHSNPPEPNVIKEKNFYDLINEAKSMNTQIQKMSTVVEDKELIQNIKEINETVNKIIATIEKNPEKQKKVENFFSYYLPVTLKILKKYDEIENQRLITEESKKFMKSTQDMIQKINQAFKKQLSNLYQSDMIDTDAEMKVFETMLNSEGFNQEDDFKL